MSADLMLDRLTVRVTAFGSWAEFCAAMRGGYCPTLRPVLNLTCRADVRWNAAVARLTECVRAAGFEVFDGRRVS